MFDRLRNVLFRPAAGAGGATPAQRAQDQVSRWASRHGLQYAPGDADAFSLQGHVRGRPWRMELGPSIRDYIHGEELRARAELEIDDEVAVLVIGRVLKDTLERRAFAMITDTLQTTADPNLPEEMRWLAMYDEVGWEGPAPEFWRRFAVLGERRDDAAAWLSPSLTGMLTDWPDPEVEPPSAVPVLLVLLRGRCYFRMAYQPAEPATLQHATEVFTVACERAVEQFHKGRR